MASTLEWFKKIAERLVRQEEKSTHREPNLFPRVYDSRLEDRRVLNAGAVVSAVDLLALRFDAGQSANDFSTDKFELVRLESSNGANQIAVTINDQRVWQGRSTELHSVRFDGSNDADQFFIDPTIQFHDGIYVNGTGVSTGPQSLGSSDLVVFATTSHLRFDEIIYQTSDQLTQVRFASPSQHLNSLVQVQNVETIRDLSLATDRTIAIGSPNNSYVLQNEQPMSERPALQFSNQKNRLEFTVPSNRLTIDTLAATANRNSIMIDTVNLQGLDQLKIAGSDSDIVRQKGHLTVGRSLTIEAGTINIDGSIAIGPEGEVRLDAGLGILSVNGVISSRGDDLHRGGSVVLTGDRVSLQEGTRIDVSGGTGGGQIRVGGGYQGKDSSLRNSHHTYVAATASLNADARINGNGGTVIVWSDDTAIIDGSGNIFARGGSTAGDGGFIETSGKKFLKVDGSANAFAFNGKSGTWLLDPNNIEIVTVAGATPLTSYVLISTIESGLATGNVSIITNTGGAGDGDITIVDALTLAPVSRTLTLNATRDIKFLSGLTGNSNLQVSLVAGRDVDTSAVAIGQLGALTITAARNIILGSVNLSGGTFAATIDSNNNNSNATFQSTGALSAGSISIAGSTTVNDDVTLSSTVTSTTGAIQFSNIDDLAFQADVSAATNITFTSVTGPLSLGSNVDVTANNGPINFSSVTSGIQLAGSNASINILAANGATGSLTLGSVSATNPTVSLTLSSSTNTTVGSIDIQDGNLEVTIDSDNNDSNAAFQSTGALSAGSISIAGSTTVNDDVTLGSTVTATTGAIQFLNIDDLAFQGDVTAATSVTSTSVTGSLSLGSNVDVTANNGPINFSSITSGIQLAGSNGSTNILTANGATGSLTLGSVSATNPTVSLTLSSSTNTSVGSIDIQNGSLAVTIDSDNNNSGATFQSTGALSAGSISIAGSTTVNDDVTLGSTVTSTTGAIQYSQVDDLSFQGDVTAATNITFTSVTGPLSLGSNVDVTANNGPINFSSITAGIQLAGSNGSTNILTTKGATGSLTLGSVSATNATVSLTLSSSTNTSVGSIDIQNGSLAVTIDSDNNNSNATFQSTGALSAGTISIAGSTTVNDDVTLGSTVTSTTGAIQFSQVEDLSFQGDVTAATNITFTSVTGPLSLGSNVDVTANNGPINFSSITSGIQLAGSNGSTNIIKANGATGSLTLGNVSATNSTISLTLSSSTNTSVGSIDIQNGSLAVTIDSNNNDAGATFQSTGALSGGTISIAGSTTVNDHVTIGSTATATTGAIQFSNIDDLAFQGDVTAATNVTFTNVTGPLVLGSNVDVTANNGSLDFSSISFGVLLGGANGTTNSINANGSNSSLTLSKITATNSNVSLTLTSDYHLTAEDIDIQSGSLDATFNDLNTKTDAVASFQAVTAGGFEVSGNSRVNDRVRLNGFATIGTGGVLINQFNDLEINAALTSAGDITATGIVGSKTHLAANVTSNGGNIGMNGGTLLIDGNAARSISSGGGAVAVGGSITLGSLDGENGAADLTIDSRGTATAGSISLGSVTATSAGLNRLNIRTDAATAGQVTLGSIRLVTKTPGTAASLNVNSNGGTILANGTIDLSSNSSINGGSVDFGLSKLAPSTPSSTLTIKTNNTNTSGGDGGVIKLGGVVNNGVNYFDSLLLDTSAANSAKTHGDLDFGGTSNPTLAVDGTSGTGISLIGTILKAFSGALSFLTNPGGATQSSSSIDVTKADFKTTQGLTFDTSGGNRSTTAGNVLIGDLGMAAAERPTAFNVDTRGTTTTGNLVLDDGAGPSTELHVNGDLNLSKTKVKLTDNGVIRTYGTGNMTLGEVATSTATARNLTLDSQANIVVSSIALLGGSLTATIDSNNNDAGATFQSTGALSGGTISIAGSTTVNDHVTIGSTATSTTGAIQFWNIDDLAFQGDVTAATNVTFTNVTGPLVLGSNVDVTANTGSLDFSSISAGVLLGGVTGSTNVMEAKGNTSQVSLAPVTTTNASVRLNVRSDYSADLQSIDMQNGTLDVIIGRSTTRTDASVLLRHVTAGRLSVAGTSQLNDTAVLNDTLAIGANGVTLQKFSVLDVNANVQSVGDVVVTNIGDRIRIAGSVRVESNAGIDLQGNVQQIQLIGADGSENHFQANGEASVFKLAELSSLQNVNLVLRSADSVHLLGVDTKNGMLTIDVDGNINAVGSRLDSNFLRAGQIAITGSLAKDDLAVINGSMEARTGNIVIDSFGSVSWNGDVTASSSIRVTNLSNRLNIGSGRMVRSLNGDVDLTTNLNQVNFIGGSGTTTTIAATNGSLRIAAMTENIASSLVELRADRDVLLKSSLMASNLRVVAGDHNGPSGSINTVSTLAASSIRLEAATGIGTTSALATAASSIDATNRFSGAVQIANSLAGPVLVSNLVSNLGGNIDFRQSGGGLVRFQRVNSNPDTSPAANEATIRLRNDGGGLIIEGTGVLSGGLGGVNLETISAGDIQLDANTQALNGGVSINSARRIVGNGPIQGLSINLNAGTGIGTSAPLQAHSTQLSAVTGSGTINVTNASSVRANVSELRSNALGSILFRQVGGGDVAFSSVSTGLAISNADSNIRLFNDNGSIFVERASPIAGGIVAGGGGSILFTAQDNLVLESGAIIETQGATATIRGNAGGRVQFIPGATIRAGSSNPTTEAVVTRIPPLVWVQTVVNFDGVNVDSEGVASILVQLGGPNPILVDRNFSVVIDWGDNQVDHFPNGLISSGTTNPQIARFDASGVNYQITHKYLGNPNPSDPVADIPVSVKVGVDSLNRIQFSDSQNVASSQFQVVNEKLVVPAAGLFSLSFVIPQTPSVQTRLVFNNASQAENATASSLTVKSAEFEVSSSNSSVEQKRTYVLRVITPINEEGGVDTSKDIPLAETDIDDLSGLFRRLGDDRYRIYLIREDGSQMMLKDFYLRNHRPIEIDDAPASELLPAEERVLDESASVSTERPDTTMAGANEDASTQNNEEKALVTNSTMAIGASAPAMRSWRKAARRFRAS